MLIDNSYDLTAMDDMIVVIGRGHSGTRILANILLCSGVYMGPKVNESGDKVPPENMYEACKIIARHVRRMAGATWNFTSLFDMPIDPLFTKLVFYYIADLILSQKHPRGWKLPETTLILPWLTRLFPDFYYIYIVRDPRDAILGPHITDDLQRFGISYPECSDVIEQRALSWLYHYELVKATPKPRRWHTVRFEDLILDQSGCLKGLETFLNISLAEVSVSADPVGRWQRQGVSRSFKFLLPAMKDLGYVT